VTGAARTAVEVCQEVAAPETLDDESRSPIEVDLSVERGDRCPGGGRGGEHERLTLDGGPLLAREAEPQHTAVVDREDLSFATSRETFERLEPDLVLHRRGRREGVAGHVRRQGLLLGGTRRRPSRLRRR
jgi:hypothetical protein